VTRASGELALSKWFPPPSAQGVCGRARTVNTAASYRHGGHQRERFDTAIGSAREVRAGLHVAIAAGYVTDAECGEALDCADKIAATLWSCLRGSGRRSA
jgi:hypothetical protein